jgi:hypothetical protein
MDWDLALLASRGALCYRTLEELVLVSYVTTNTTGR